MSRNDPKPQRKRHRWLVALVVIVASLGLVEYLISWTIAQKLGETLSEHVDAELRIAHLVYIPPYGVHVWDAKLARGDRVYATIGQLDLRLARVPLGRGPVVISSVLIKKPVLNLTRDAGGISPGPSLIKNVQKPRPARKLSEALQLRSLRIAGGRVTYDDQLAGASAPDLVWDNIDSNITTVQKSASSYIFKVTAGSGTLADVTTSGTIDVDSLDLAITSLTAKLKTDPRAATSPLPPLVQAQIARFNVDALLTVEGRGQVPLRQPMRASYTAAVNLQRATAWSPQIGPIERAQIRLEGEKKAESVNSQIRLASFEVFGSGRHLVLDDGQIDIDHPTSTWTLNEFGGHADAVATTSAPAQPPAKMDRFKPAGRIDFTGVASGPLRGINRESVKYELLAYPRDFAFQPARFPMSIQHITGGRMRLADGLFTFEQLAGVYGNDRITLRFARLPVEGLPRSAQYRDIDSTVVFGPPLAHYSPNMERVLHLLAPGGPFLINGSYTVDHRTLDSKNDFDLMIYSDSGAMSLTKWGIPFTEIHGEARVTPAGVDLRHAEATALAGKATLTGHYRNAATPSYDGIFTLENANLEHLSELDIVHRRDGRSMRGRGRLSASFFGTVPGRARPATVASTDLGGSGSTPTSVRTEPKDPAVEGAASPEAREAALSALRGSGQVEVFDSEIFQVPVLREIFGAINGDREAATAGQGAAFFEIENQIITLNEAAANAPVLGLHGNGKVSFDGELDLKVVAAPLADWRQKMKETKIPLVSDVAGEIVGGVQKLLNAATSTLIYEFHITGSVHKPEIFPVPAPVLSETGALLFGRMLGLKQDQHVIGLLNKPQATRP